MILNCRRYGHTRIEGHLANDHVQIESLKITEKRSHTCREPELSGAKNIGTTFTRPPTKLIITTDYNYFKVAQASEQRIKELN